MTITSKGCAGASPAGNLRWHSIQWNIVRKNVERLQVRIAKAVRQNRWGKVKALQHILVNSISARLLAVQIVTTNKGKKTPGIDGILWKNGQTKLTAAKLLSRRGYRANPLRRIYIPKRNGKRRPLGIPTMHDRACQALHNFALLPVAETKADPHSYGFRPRRSVADAIEQCHTVLASADRAHWVLEGDIRACFDEISHPWLLANVPMDKRVLKQWLNAGFVEDHAFHSTVKGTPQGGPVSPTLANMVLDGLQAEIAQAVPKGSKVNFVRYADDFICTGKKPEILENVVTPIIRTFLGERGLSLSSEKTRITHIKDGFDFLGFNLRKFKGKLIISPSRKKIGAFHKELRRVIKESLPRQKNFQLVQQLNAKLRGWSNFYRGCCAKKAFSTVDSVVFETLWRQLKRCHANKSSSWIKRRYFTSKGFRNWIFNAEERKGNQRRSHILLSASSFKIRRHIKIRSRATVFDPEYRSYLQKRLAIFTARRLSERNVLQTTTRWVRVFPNQRSLPFG